MIATPVNKVLEGVVIYYYHIASNSEASPAFRFKQ